MQGIVPQRWLFEPAIQEIKFCGRKLVPIAFRHCLDACPMLRGYLLELLIRPRAEELVIWHDTRPPLSRYASYVPMIGVRLDRPTYLWHMVRWLVSMVGPRLPRRLATDACWIA
jgi:hypothetical protein